MKPVDYLKAARVPAILREMDFGHWRIVGKWFSGYQDPMNYPGAYFENAIELGWEDYTVLLQMTPDYFWHTVMEDSARELRRHLPIWLAAHGRVLVSGLGLGCVVRGLLAKPSVEHVDVVELDRDILRVVGQEFEGNSRVTLRQGNALRVTFPRGTKWDFAWHDISTPNGDKGLQVLHGKLLLKFRHRVKYQGAWGFPRSMARVYSKFLGPLLGRKHR
jgi:hypothetical protein